MFGVRCGLWSRVAFASISEVISGGSEVDAPLDDSNVDRFCAMMEEMARTTDTRFLVITHHPMTMSRMNRLFGVTMQEKGVSQLVSVDLQAAERFREAS